jgi:exodeoxyribonuclease VII large subunit
MEGPDLFSHRYEDPPEEVPPPADGPRIWTVSEVNRAVRGLLEFEMPALRVAGEVANWTRARSGHCYFTLKDEVAQLRCVMWKGDAGRLPMDPEEGMRVRAFGAATLYEARGEFQLTVRELEGEGEAGLWKLAFEKLRIRLAAEGLLDPSRRRRLPPFPRSIGVVTSLTGAALHDILNVLGRRAPWTRVVLRGTRVQGEGAALEIAQAIRTLAASGEVELLIVGRGGGSIEDLWAFNEEPVARAIAECPVPVISAVGHETDITIADLVADLRAPTPSAAAESAVRDGGALREILESARLRLVRSLRHQVERRGNRVLQAKPRFVRALQRRAAAPRNNLERRTDRMANAMRGLLQQRRSALGAMSGRVNALSPLSTLERGYAVPLGERGRVLKRVDDFRTSGSFVLRVVDGRVRCETLEVEEDR